MLLSLAEFFPSLKRLLGTLVYCLFLCGSILRFNAIIGQITYTPKYLEQQFGLSTTRANFLVGKQEYGVNIEGPSTPPSGRWENSSSTTTTDAVTQNIIDIVLKGYDYS